MKRITQIFLFLFTAHLASAQAILYVKSTAIGANDGSNWLNAYTSLETALIAAQPGDQIWVATGSYKSDQTYPNNTFEVQSGVELYGGFAGTETSLGQRNIATNLTILTGDALGNDLPGVFATNRTDNALHVVHTSNGSPTARAVIDGFTISGGATLTGANDPAASKRGGGIHVESKATIRNCTFTDNYGENGVSIMAPSNLANGLVIDNCLFQGNEATQRGAGVYFIGLDGVEMNKCVFKNNKTNRGCLYPRSSKNVVLDSLSFEDNIHQATNGYATGIYNFDGSITLTNSQFLNNSAGNACAIYNANMTNTLIKGCLFDGNVTTDYGGGGLMNFQSDFRVDSCIFRNASAPSSAAAIYNGDTCTFVISNCVFDGLSANYASAVANYGAGCVGTFDNCTFTGNTATNGGGACSNGFQADVLYKDCTFDGNTSMFGGAIFTQNDTTRLRIEGGTFMNNGAETNGGVIYKNPNIHVSIKGATFQANSADIGAAIYAVLDSALVVENTVFSDNLCFTQGAAVNIGNANSWFTNCVFVRNLNLSTGNYGGALINNASDSVTSTVTMINCTVADNLAPFGAGLAQWEDDTSSAVLVLQNCLIQNPEGDNYGIEAGTPTIISLGGNQSSDATFAADFTGTKDLNETINTFADPNQADYHLLLGAAVDGGVEAGAPLYDIEGVQRVGPPDVGAYEWGTNGLFQPGLSVLPLQIAPNPVTTAAILSLNNDWTGKAVVEVYSANGTLVRAIRVEKQSGSWQYRLDVADLPAGTYRVLLNSNEKVYGASFVK